MKAFTNNNSYMAQIGQLLFDMVENMARKRENAGCKYVLLFPFIDNVVEVRTMPKL